MHSALIRSNTLVAFLARACQFLCGKGENIIIRSHYFNFNLSLFFPDSPENVPRLFDLVRCDDAVKPAFYFAVRDTLVAKDLEQATRIAYGKTRFRVVTLSGELIDQSGVWTVWLLKQENIKWIVPY